MLKVLIVDDDRNIVKLLDFTLQNAGFSVTTARNGDEGLASATAQPPDVAVLDVMMPGMHGYDLCRHLRANPNTAHAKIIFLTARSQPIDEQEARKAGADLFLSKPVMPDDLVQRVQALVSDVEQAAPAPEETAVEVQPKPQKADAPPAKPKGRTIVCYSPSPGVGVTTVAANLALALALSRRAQTPVVELHSTPGNLLSALALSSEPPIGDLTATVNRLDWDTLALHLVDHPSGVQVLPAPPPGSYVPPALTQKALAILRTHYPLVLADAASELDDRVQPALLAADLVMLVITAEVPVIQAALESIRELHALDFPERQILLVVNHVRSQSAVSLEKIRKGMEHPLFAIIPHQPEMKKALDSGRPILTTHARSPAARAIGRMALKFVQSFNLPLGDR